MKIGKITSVNIPDSENVSQIVNQINKIRDKYGDNVFFGVQITVYKQDESNPYYSDNSERYHFFSKKRVRLE